jgi:hypothetical protein
MYQQMKCKLLAANEMHKLATKTKTKVYSKQ